MAAKYYGTTHRHPFSWDDVASAIFLRYPNPLATHVLSEDTLFRELRGQVLYSRRFLTKTNRLPKWGEKFFGNLKRFVPLVEESHVDVQNRVVTTYTRNVGLSRFMTAVEKVQYVADPDNPQETIAIKEAWIESGLYGIRSAVKSFGIERFKQNCLKATEGFNYVLQHLHSQQYYLKEVRQRKWQEMKQRGETLRDTAMMAAEKAKAHSTVNASSSD